MVPGSHARCRPALEVFDEHSPRYYPYGGEKNAGDAHLDRLHRALSTVGIPEQGKNAMHLSDQQFLDLLRKAYNLPLLDGVVGDLQFKNRTGKVRNSGVLSEGVTPSEAWDSLMTWFQEYQRAYPPQPAAPPAKQGKFF